jgi:hypothetical protein
MSQRPKGAGHGDIKVTPYENNHSDCSLYITIYDSKLKINRNKSDKQLAMSFHHPRIPLSGESAIFIYSDFAPRGQRDW